MPRDCKHGQLARSCNACELESERELLASALMLLVKNDMLAANNMDIVLDAMRLAREILKTKPNEGSV